MPNPNTDRAHDTAPYRVFAGDAAAAFAHDIRALALELSRAQDNQQAVMAAYHRRMLTGLPIPFPHLPHPVVVDRHGRERPDLATTERICRRFGRRIDELAGVVDRSPCWDGDNRPRGLPVAGTGRRVRYGRAWMRNPATQRDRRMGQAEACEGEPPVRGARRPHALPSAWDDLPRRDVDHRSWKRHRRHQWR